MKIEHDGSAPPLPQVINSAPQVETTTHGSASFGTSSTVEDGNVGVGWPFVRPSVSTFRFLPYPTIFRKLTYSRYACFSLSVRSTSTGKRRR
jgi:hypothetical protein